MIIGNDHTFVSLICFFWLLYWFLSYFLISFPEENESENEIKISHNSISTISTIYGEIHSQNAKLSV